MKNFYKNINEAWLVCKKYNGKLYFKSQYYKDQKDVSYANIYWEKSQAETEITNLNAVRTKIKYFLEPANKHFINEWRYHFNTWNGFEINIENKPQSLEEAIRNKYKTNSFNSIKQNVITKILEHKAIKEVDLEKIKNSLEIRVNELKKQINENIKSAENNLLNLNNTLLEINEFDFDNLYKTHETPLEKTYKVLYENQDK